MRGKLLVAVPGMLDPNFAATVVYLFADDDGAAGVILNRPTDLDVAETLPDLEGLVAPPSKVFFGGPVRTDEAVVIGVRHGALVLMDDGSSLDAFDAARVFAGYAGWAEGQLEAEIDAGGWFVVDAAPGDVVTPDPDDLRRAVFARQPGELQRYANYPADPSLN